ncbi:hypothetical protein AB0E65_21325, partial [Streptomyces fragilis]
ALRPVTLPDAGTRTATTAPAGPEARPATPVRGAVNRAPLGAPLSELPPTAVPLAQNAAVPPPVPGGRGVSGPALPVVQRRADGASGGEGSSPSSGPSSGPRSGGTDTPARGGLPDGAVAPPGTSHRPSARTGARARGGLGAPLPALPPSADVTGASAPGAVPGTAHGGRTPTGPASRPTAAAPLLGRGGVQRSLTAGSSDPSTTRPGTAHQGEGPATPLVSPPPPATVTGSPVQATAVTAPGPAPAAQRQHGTASPGGPRSVAGQSHGAPAGSAGPVPLVAARRVAEDVPPAPGGGGRRPPGVVGTRPLPVSRSLSLLAARPLPLNTGLPEGALPPPTRAGSRPVVAARWATTPDAAAPVATTPDASARAMSARSAAASAAGGTVPGRTPLSHSGGAPPTPAGPPNLRAATGGPAPVGAAARSTGGPAPVQRVPVVRPAPPSSGAPGPGAPAPSAAVPARTLPVTAPQAAPPAGLPAATSATPVPAGDVPVVRWRRTGSDGGSGGAAPAVQRTGPGIGAGPTTAAGNRPPQGGPAKAGPAGGRPRSASAPVTAHTTGSASAPAGSRARGADPAQDPGLDLDDLARRLLDPVARLLRAELRRGRERTGRPHDGRR